MKRGQAQRLEKETQRRLIEAGMLLFGLHGLEATSTRALAMEAGVNLAAIPYHFGGKKGLYLAVLEHIVRIKLAEIGPCLDRVLAACAERSTGREVLVGHLREMTRVLVVAMLGNPESRACSQIMMQEQIAPTAGFDVFHETFLLRIHAAWSALLHRFTGLPLGSMELRLRTISIMGQMFIFRVGMPSLLKLVESDRLPDGYLEAITDICIQQAEALVAGFAPVCSGANA